MKLFLFQSGSIRTKKSLLVEGESETEIEVPVPFYLITHPGGNLLFDTGQPRSAMKGPLTGDYIPVMNKADYVSPQLKKAGLTTSHITQIVLSHLHSDHAGGLEAFKNTECFIQEKELLADERNRDGLRWRYLNGDYDVFGDGLVRIVSTPGHSPGHQSLLLKLEKSGKVLLTSDSVYLDEILDHNVLPGVYYDREATRRTIQMIRDMRQHGISVICGHDPVIWSRLKHAPDYYE